VKITVIATGFRESEMRRPRLHESYDPVIVSREARHVSQHASRRDHFDDPAPMIEPEPVFEPEPAFEPETAPVGFQESTVSASHSAAVISMDAMRSAPTYEVEDLDVPAFLRKRNEVM